MQEFNEGDLVEAVKGETVVRGRARPHVSGGLAVGECMAAIAWYQANGFTVTILEKAAPKLPTEPGWYESEEFPLGTSADYEPYSLNTDGKWYTADGQLLTPTGLREQGNLRRLEPVPVTAKKVLDALRGRIGSIDSAHDFQAVAAEFGVEA